VTDARNFGFFVDVPGLGMSGLVPSVLHRGRFLRLRRRRAAIWSAGAPGRVIKLGDRVTVQVYKVDSFKKQVDFQLVTSRPRPPRASRRPGRPPGGNAGRHRARSVIREGILAGRERRQERRR
jgi:ribonuclease R